VIHLGRSASVERAGGQLVGQSTAKATRVVACRHDRVTSPGTSPDGPDDRVEIPFVAGAPSDDDPQAATAITAAAATAIGRT
jgi:hypothetical protein